MLSVEQLIALGFIFQEEPKATLEDGFISFLPTDGHVIRLPSQRGDGVMTATKFEMAEDDEGIFWIIQLEGLPEDPNTFLTDTQQPFEIFRKIEI